MRKIKKQYKYFIGIFTIIILSIIIWYFLSKRPYSPFSPIAEIINAAREIFSKNELYSSILNTISMLAWSLGIGLFFGYLFGIILGLLMDWGKGVRDGLEAFRAIPVTAFIPFFIMVIGLKKSMFVALAMLPIFSIVVANIAQEIYIVGLRRKKQLNSIGIGFWNYFRHCVFWESLGTLCMSLRVSLSYALALIVALDYFLEYGNGLGALMKAYYHYGQMEFFPLIWIVLCLIALIPTVSLALFERILRRWNYYVT